MFEVFFVVCSLVQPYHCVTATGTVKDCEVFQAKVEERVPENGKLVFYMCKSKEKST